MIPFPNHPVGYALYSAIIANPEEDTPRLVFADWLDENSQPEEAKFIRDSINIGKLQRKSQTYNQVVCSLHRLLKSDLFEPRKLGFPFPNIDISHTQPRTKFIWSRAIAERVEAYATVKRGWIDSVNIRFDDWVKHGGGILQRNPLIQTVDIREMGGFYWKPRLLMIGGVQFYEWLPSRELDGIVSRFVNREISRFEPGVFARISQLASSGYLPECIFDYMPVWFSIPTVPHSLTVINTRFYRNLSLAFAGLSFGLLRFAGKPMPIKIPCPTFREKMKPKGKVIRFAGFPATPRVVEVHKYG